MRYPTINKSLSTKYKRRLDTAQVLDRLYGSKHIKPCHYCKCNLLRKDATFDHKTPLSRGGYDSSKNGAICCWPCNKRKGNMTEAEFLALLKKEN